MRAEEAETLAKWVLDLRLPQGTICLNIGSSTAHFREQEKPHIQSRFIRPLEEAGIRFVHCDMKRAEGVDEIGDVFDPDFQARLQAYDAKLLVCSNLLEHLTQPRTFAAACGSLIRDGAYAVFSVPLSYPYHPDPIDTMLRVKPDQLAAMLPEWRVLRSGEIDDGSFWGDLKKSGRPWRALLKHIGRVALPFYRSKKWRSMASYLSWLGRPYKISMVLLEKPEHGRA